MNEPTLVLENDREALMLSEETPSATGYDACGAADATAHAYSTLTERPADFKAIFVPQRRQYTEAASTYTALKEPPADFHRMALLAPPRRHPAEQAIPTYEALTEPPADFAEIPIVPETPAVPTNQYAERTVASRKSVSAPAAA